MQFMLLATPGGRKKAQYAEKISVNEKWKNKATDFQPP